MAFQKSSTPDEEALILESMGRFLERDVHLNVHRLEAADEYPHDIADRLALTEPDCGTDLQTIRTRADREGGEYILNGASPDNSRRNRFQ